MKKKKKEKFEIKNIDENKIEYWKLAIGME